MEKILNLFGKIIDISFIYVLWIFALISDCYLLTLFKMGFLEIDLNEIFNINWVKHILSIIFIFWISYFWISTLIDFFIIKIGAYINPNSNNSDYIFIYDLKKKAIDSNNLALMNYTLNGEESKIKSIQCRKIIYTLYLFLIINSFYKHSLIRNIFLFLKNIHTTLSFIFLCILIIIIGITIYNSIKYDDRKIFNIK